MLIARACDLSSIAKLHGPSDAAFSTLACAPKATKDRRKMNILSHLKSLKVTEQLPACIVENRTSFPMWAAKSATCSSRLLKRA